MGQITLRAKSDSQPEPYAVVFSVTDGLLKVACNCHAGSFGTICKHKLALARGDDARLSNKSENAELKQVRHWVLESELEQALNELATAEQQLLQSQRNVKQRKDAVAMLMVGGAKVNCVG